MSVAQRFLLSIPDIDPAVRDQLGHHMAHAHTCVGAASTAYLESCRRYNYTTPKSYLELISLYKDLLARKRTVGSAGLSWGCVVLPQPCSGSWSGWTGLLACVLCMQGIT